VSDVRDRPPVLPRAQRTCSELKINRRSTAVLKKTLFRGIPLILLLYFISYWWYTSAMG